MAGLEPKYDSALMGILSNEGEISNFLNVIFGFLYRRTDYYRLLKTEDDKIGFPPGVAAKLLFKEFQKYEQLAGRDDKNERDKAKATNLTKDSSTDTKTKNTAPTNAPPAAAATASKPAAPPTDKTANKPAADKTVDKPAADKTTDKPSDKAGSGDQKNSDSKDDTDTKETKQQAAFQADPMSYNGAVREKYAWSQSITDVDIRVFVPQHIKKGKQVEVVIDKRHLRVCFPDDKGEKQTVVDEDLQWEVNKEECMWTLAPGEHVHVNLEKREERWWEAALVSEPKINVRKIDCSRPMTDLDDEAQAKIGEMMYNEQQKRMGLPQSHEQKTHDMLRKAWDAEGSPFKGKPFDPSVLSVNSSGVVSVKGDKS